VSHCAPEVQIQRAASTSAVAGLRVSDTWARRAVARQPRRQPPRPSALPCAADNRYVIQPRGIELVEVIAWLLASAVPPMGAPVKDQQTEEADKSKPHCGGVDAMGPPKPLVVIVR
jgi:hypothetical protein